MIKSLLPLFLLTVSFLFSYGQSPLIKQWDARFGGTSDDELFSFQQTGDGGYILGGYSFSGAGGDKSQPGWGSSDYWIVKLDSLGIKQWDKDFGGTSLDRLYALKQTTDGGYILGGASNSGTGGDKTQAGWGNYDYWIVKTDSLGNTLWDKDFGGPNKDILTALQQTRDGGYILGGYSFSGMGGDKTQLSRGNADYWVVKINSLGIKQWDKSFGATYYDELYCLQQTADGGYILGGRSNSGINGDKTQDTQGASDYWLVKIDSLGNKIWDKDIGGIYDDYLLSITLTTDGGYLLGGWSESGIGGDKTQAGQGSKDYWIVKIDSAANIKWDKDFGGTGLEDEFEGVSETTDRVFLIAGTSYSPLSGDKTEANLGGEQTWIVKTDSLGNKEWDKTIFAAGHDEAGYGILARDGCYVFANFDNGGVGGYRTQPNQDTTALPNTTYDYWIVRFCQCAQSSSPLANFTSSDSTFCSEPIKCINFRDNSCGNPISWQWDFPGGSPSSSTLQNPDSVCYYNAGTFPVTLIVTNALGSDTLTVSPMIVVGGAPPAPTITILGGDTLISSQASFYQWFYNGSAISGATDSFYVAQQWGTYAVMITDSNGCSRLSGGVAGGVDEISGGGGIEVYPNPVDKEFTVYSLRFTVGETMEINNVLGKKVKTEKLSANGKTIVDVRDLVAGVYFLTITNERGRFVGKFVKE